MPYAVMRILGGNSPQSAQEIDRIVQAELLQELNRAGGLHRYTTLQFSDGRLGSVSSYEDQSTAQRGSQIASQWLASTSVMGNYKLEQTLEGEIIVSLSGAGEQVRAGQSGIGRIYQTEATLDQIHAAFQEITSTIQALGGFVRLTAVRLANNQGVGVFSTFTNPEAANGLSELARQLRTTSGSRIAQVFPNDPQQTLQATVINSYIPTSGNT